MERGTYMAIKMITTDIDGTLLNNNKQISTHTKEVLQEARRQGIYVVLCSGRPLVGVQEYLSELGLTGNDDYVITFNGAQVQHGTGDRPLIANLLTGQDFCLLDELAHKLGVRGQAVTPDGNIYLTTPDISPVTVMDSYFTKMLLHVRPAALPTEVSHLAKYMWADVPKVLDQAIDNLPQKVRDKYYCVHSEEWFFEFMHPLATKGQAMVELAGKLKIMPSEVMAVGDQDNDLTMIETAGLGVAMGNANSTVKQEAQVVTEDNEHDGLAVAVEKYVL